MTLILNVLTGLFAITLIVVGVLTAFSPVPFGILFIAIGLVLLSTVAPPVRDALRNLRRRWRWLDRRLDDAQDTLPDRLSDPLRATDPEDEDEADEPGDNINPDTNSSNRVHGARHHADAASRSSSAPTHELKSSRDPIDTMPQNATDIAPRFEEKKTTDISPMLRRRRYR
ncbi:MAG: hypothetical protein AAF850_06605 [Pseudomonadota bacterium]